MALLKLFRASEAGLRRLFEVQTVITDPDNHPIPNVGGRMVLGAEPGWEKQGRGARFETGADGRTIFKMEALLRQGSRKRPTNFLDGLFGHKQATDDLQIAVELVYAGDSLLYVAQLLVSDATGPSCWATGQFFPRTPTVISQSACREAEMVVGSFHSLADSPSQVRDMRSPISSTSPMRTARRRERGF